MQYEGVITDYCGQINADEVNSRFELRIDIPALEKCLWITLNKPMPEINEALEFKSEPRSPKYEDNRLVGKNCVVECFDQIQFEFVNLK